MNTYTLIKRPIISEKSMSEAQKGKFMFEVSKLANKPMIKQAIEKVFKVKVLHVATSIVKGKKKRVGTKRIEVEKSSWKKAIVTLQKDQKIDLFETGELKTLK